VPRCVAARAAALAAALGPPGAAPLRGDAALLNYYATGDALGGHVDDAEACESPLVAVSMGCPAVFLLGGDDVHSAPLPLLLRGGDALLLGGPARRATHGLPRVLTPSDAAPPQRAAAAARDALAAVRAAGGDEAQAVAAWMQHTRINISVRDIYCDGADESPGLQPCKSPAVAPCAVDGPESGGV
jgi:alkylated DNA repair protein alkB family protein 1